jgi:hypothetical protein
MESFSRNRVNPIAVLAVDMAKVTLVRTRGLKVGA